LDKKALLFYKKILFIISLLVAVLQTNPHAFVLAEEINIDYGRGPVELLLVNHPDNPIITTVNGDNTLPTVQDLEYYTTYITATAYTSRASETDDSPFTAAWGDQVYWGMVASNAFPRGTKIQIPDYYGDKVFVVLDRMNARYYYRLDIWMPELPDAKNWGSRYIKINVLK
jgi:3D (Asp-Asp-Asp) domain-containing protein